MSKQKGAVLERDCSRSEFGGELSALESCSVMKSAEKERKVGMATGTNESAVHTEVHFCKSYINDLRRYLVEQISVWLQVKTNTLLFQNKQQIGLLASELWNKELEILSFTFIYCTDLLTHK